ncbi:MAG TPA: DUF1627 domain-containing protein [Scandinavium sp.]|jgi:hypothetical protein
METVLQALEAMKKATSLEISRRTGLTQREVINQLWDYKRKGWVVQQGKTWLSVEPTQDAVQPTDSVAAVLESITPFTSTRRGEMVIPTVRGVSREIRRAKAKVAQLERLRDAVRELSKHKHLIQEVMP